MSPITVSGLSTGIDYDTLISQLLDVERARLITPMENKKSRYEEKVASYTDLASKMESLESAADALRFATGFGAKTVTVSDEDILTAQAGSDATTGNYSIKVSALALEHKVISGNGVASSTSTIAGGSGNFTFKIGETGTEYTVAVTSSMTLEEFKNALNSLDEGIRATIINEGSGATPYRLILSTETTGADNKIIITQDDTDLGYPVNDTELTSGLHLQKPQDASLTIDTLAVTRTTNTITDLVPGVTLSLRTADPTTTVTVQVERDTDAIKESISELIAAYNEVITYVNGRSGYDTEDHTADPLYGEGTVRSIVRRMGSIVASGISGLPSDMKSLAQIGVLTERDGTLTLNEGTLDDALDDDVEKVMNLFIDSDTTTGVAAQFYELANTATLQGEGDLSVRVDGLNSRIRSLESTIDQKEEALERYERRLRSQFAALESLITSFQNQDQLFGIQG